MTDGRLVVLDDDAHGIPAAEYAAILEDRLGGWEIIHPRSPAERTAAIADATVIAGKYFAAEEVAAADSLRLFSANTAGVDHLPVDAFADAGVAVTSASGVHGPNIAEYVIGYILSFMRRHDEGRRRQQARTWRRYQAFGELAGGRSARRSASDSTRSMSNASACATPPSVAAPQSRWWGILTSCRSSREPMCSSWPVR
jgi:hypothetical protein